MEEHHEELMDLENKIQTMLSDHDFPAVFDVCEETFPHIVPSIQFRKKREIEPQTPDLFSFLAIVKYAPLLFEHWIIESFAAFISENRFLARHEKNYPSHAQTALEFEEAARMLWNKLEQEPGYLSCDIQRDLNIEKSIIDSFLETWEELGVVVCDETDKGRVIHLQSCTNIKADGICHTCGTRGKGRKELFYKPVPCTKCGTTDYFCITSTMHR